MNRTWLVVLVLAIALGDLRAQTEEFSSPIESFSLTERSGKTVSSSDLHGKVWIASFIVTRCPDGKCPQVTQTMQRLQGELRDRRNLMLVTFTTDPSNDDPGELTRYAERFEADPNRWLFLTGSEEKIDELLRSFLLRSRDETFQKGRIDHAQRLVVVDKQGNLRGFYDGMDDPNYPEGHFERNLLRLRRQVDQLLQPELPAWMPRDVPAFNALLNAVAGMLLLIGYQAIRMRWTKLHIACMLTAVVVSALFLASYLFYHLYIKEGRPTRFAEQAPDAPAWVGQVYLAILGSHTLLAIPVAPMALITAYLGLRGKLSGHVRLARWTLPIWLYVSFTGVLVYLMLYRLYPSP